MRGARKSAASGVIYPETDHMGEHELQRLIAELLRPMLARFLAERGIVAHVGADQFVYWEEGNPAQRLAPDVYVLPNVDPNIALRSWKTWETGIAPSFVLEVASDDFERDYDHNPALYAALGVRELVVFDPHARASSRGRRVRWQVFRRVANRGLVRVDVSQGDRVRSKALGAWLRAVGEGDAVRVRIALGNSGAELYPTEAEAERAAKEQERAAKEQERAAKEQERAARLSAEAEVARLRALLAERPRRGAPRPKR